MVKKRKKATKKKRSTAKKVSSVKLIRANKRKFSLVIKKFFLFLILSIVSFALFNVTGNTFLQNLFFLLSFVFGFVATAFLIVLLIFLFMKGFKK
jgi:membrane glycosyltransferase